MTIKSIKENYQDEKRLEYSTETSRIQQMYQFNRLLIHLYYNIKL